MRRKFFGLVTTRQSQDYTVLALRSFYECTRLDPQDRVYLIDNDQSFDRSVLNSGMQPLELIVNQQPLGFAANVNQIRQHAEAAEADLYFLNNDLAFAPGWIAPLLEERPAILAPFSNNQIQYQTAAFTTKLHMSLADYSGREIAWRQLAQLHGQTLGGHLPVMILPFFCVKIPAQILAALGPLDERFGSGGGEDYDYCLRAQLAGFAVEFARQSYILHFGGKSSWSGVQSGAEKIQHDLSFRTQFALKWGLPLLKACLFDDLTDIQNSPALDALLTARNYRGLIEALRPAAPA